MEGMSLSRICLGLDRAAFFAQVKDVAVEKDGFERREKESAARLERWERFERRIGLR